MTEKFRKLVEESKRILITSHTSPDPDAVASVLLLGTTLLLNFPDKIIEMVLEEEPRGLNFLDGYELIKFRPLAESFHVVPPDLIIIVDAHSYARVSRGDAKIVAGLAEENNCKLAIIDHHEQDGRDSADVYLNSGNPASVQEVYELCFSKLKLKKPAGYSQTAMLGLYSDTGGFAYQNPRHSATMQLADDLIKAGANVEQAKNAVNQYTLNDMRVLGELISNLVSEDGYNYSFLSDEFVNKWQRDGLSVSEMSAGTKTFINDFIRNINKQKWGFIAYLNPLEETGTYSLSFRSVGESKDVAKIAKKLGGGGHKPSAGAKIQAKNISEAIQTVKEAITST